jgi:hypothetical protein
MALQRLVCRNRRQHGVPGAEEGDEEGVALRVDLVAAVRVERVPQEVLVLGEEADVPVARLPQEPR